jgi:hypothetical protein
VYPAQKIRPDSSEEISMLELRSPDFLSTDFLVHRKGKSFAVWPADVDDQDDPIKVLINAETLAGTAIDSGRIKTAMEKHREIIEQLARDSYKPGDREVVVDDNLRRLMDDAIRSLP